MRRPTTTTRAASTGLWLVAMLMISASCLTSCAFPAGQVVVIPADRTLTLLPDGNYLATPAWLKDRYEYERALKARLEQCK